MVSHISEVVGWFSVQNLLVHFMTDLTIEYKIQFEETCRRIPTAKEGVPEYYLHAHRSARPRRGTR